MPEVSHMSVPPQVSDEPQLADSELSAEVGDSTWSFERFWRFTLERSAGTIMRGAIWGLLITVGGVVLGMLSQVVLARQLGTAGYGVYVYVLAAMNAASIIGKLEMDSAAVRFVAAYHATHSWGLLHGYLRTSRRWVTLSAGGVGLLAAAVIVGVQRWLPSGYIGPLLLGCALLPIASRLQVEAGYLQGFRRVRESQAPFQLLRPLVLCISLLAIGASSYRLSVRAALLFQLLASATALAVTLRLMARSTPAEVKSAPPLDDSAEWIRTVGPLMVISLSQLVLSTQTDVLVVHSFLGKEATAIYGTASQLAVLISFTFTALMLIVQPQIARLFAQKRLSDLQRLVGKVQFASLLASLAVFVVLVLFGRWALSWFGRDFRSGYTVMLILAAGQVTLATLGAIAGYLLTMTGHQREASHVIAGTAVLNLALTLVLTPRFGIIGTAVATAISILTRGAILALIVRRRVGVSLFRPAGLRALR
jgi:O-antigen/teichoic acid export membrane protein